MGSWDELKQEIESRYTAAIQAENNFRDEMLQRIEAAKNEEFGKRLDAIEKTLAKVQDLLTPKDESPNEIVPGPRERR